MKALLVAMGLVGCGAAVDCTFDDGSNACDAGPVMVDELDGMWCDALQCLDVHAGSYHWINARTWRVMSEGELTGGLEFSPLGGDGIEYSASVDWTDTGIAMFFDDGQRLYLDYRD